MDLKDDCKGNRMCMFPAGKRYFKETVLNLLNFLNSHTLNVASTEEALCLTVVMVAHIDANNE